MIIIDLSTLFAETGIAKLSSLPGYIDTIRGQLGDARVVTLTGPAPVWLYLHAGHALHGRVARLIYDSPMTGPLVIYDHDPL